MSERRTVSPEEMTEQIAHALAIEVYGSDYSRHGHATLMMKATEEIRRLRAVIGHDSKTRARLTAQHERLWRVVRSDEQRLSGILLDLEYGAPHG